MKPGEANIDIHGGDSRLESGPASQAPALFPVFLKLAGRRCLVVGAGQIGQSKIEGLLLTGASITVVAPHATSIVQAWARSGRLRWHQRGFEPSDLESIFLVVVATLSRDLNQSIYQEAQRRGVLCNAVDNPPHCDFYYPAVVRRGALQIAISTDGKSPALAQRLRKKFEAEYDPAYADWTEQLGDARQRLFAQSMDPEGRRRQLHDMASATSYESFTRMRDLGSDAEGPQGGQG